ncbi:hypothetical protein evm_003248 [Chilo suppressalis]|nr:hypothetical protein evm_003248 [Chilo suppressalis]
MVNSVDVINWVKDPVPINEYRSKACPNKIATTCPATSCGPLTSHHTEEQFWMASCNVCPRVYPWFGNPLGQ